MVKIRKYIFLAALLLSISITYASLETDWLIQEYSEKQRTIEETSLYVLALEKQLNSPPSSEIIKLKEYTNSCTQANNCKNKDLALAIWALRDTGTTKSELDPPTNWLINSRTITIEDYNPSDDWLVQVISPSNGTCSVSNLEINKSLEIDVKSDYTPWAAVESIIDDKTEILKIDCSSLSSIDSISLIKKEVTSNEVNYYIKEEIQNKKSVDVQLGIPCWGSTYRSSCNVETSAFVLLALQKQEKNLDPSWLQLQTLNPLEKSILYEITKSSQTLQELKSSQTNAGYWTPVEIFQNSIINSFLLDNSNEKNISTSWILTQKDDSGCWPKPSSFCNLRSTAAVLYALDTIPSNQVPTPPPTTNKTILQDCDEPCLNNNGCICARECKLSSISLDEKCGGTKRTDSGPGPGDFCITQSGCDGQYDSIGRCQDIPGDNCPLGDDLECNNDFVCDASEDCTCSDCDGGSCELSSGEQGTCHFASGSCRQNLEGGDIDTAAGGSKDKNEKDKKDTGSSNLFLILMIIAALIALVGGSFLAYKKGLIKFKKSSSPTSEYKPKMKIPKEFHAETYQPRTRPSKVKPHPVKKFLDKELDKSMEELEKLLKN